MRPAVKLNSGGGARSTTTTTQRAKSHLLGRGFDIEPRAKVNQRTPTVAITAAEADADEAEADSGGTSRPRRLRPSPKPTATDCGIVGEKIAGKWGGFATNGGGNGRGWSE